MRRKVPMRMQQKMWMQTGTDTTAVSLAELHAGLLACRSQNCSQDCSPAYVLWASRHMYYGPHPYYLSQSVLPEPRRCAEDAEEGADEDAADDVDADWYGHYRRVARRTARRTARRHMYYGPHPYYLSQEDNEEGADENAAEAAVA
eukprot:TRINITY_DN1686_c0_g1_i10.p2 TRINITY_DN1686_c0_g1~~TRINITY_DN1686_c0_g1_i10.p2  ORF type:complete len:146 (-),score=20.88 TRINITY_DN1686_c0_g1_i10:129-566(-)